MIKRLSFIILLTITVGYSGYTQDYFSQTSGAFDTPGIWNTMPDGSGSFANTLDFSSGAAGFIIMDTHVITSPSGDINIGDLIINEGGLFQNGDVAITIRQNTVISGTFDDVAANGITTFSGPLTVEPTGVFTVTAPNNSSFVFEGNIINRGTFSLLSNPQWSIDAAITITNESTLPLILGGFNSGNGAINADLIISDFLGGSNIVLNSSGQINLADGVTLRNELGDYPANSRALRTTRLTAPTAAAFQNTTNAIWQYGPDSPSTLPNITYDFSAIDNVVQYVGNTATQNVIDVSYYHLSILNAGTTNTLQNNLAVIGDLTIGVSSTLNTGGFDIDLFGDLINNAGTTGLNATGSTVSFSGLDMDPQTVTGQTDFDNLLINNTGSSSEVEVNSTISVASSITFTNGVLHMTDGNLLSLSPVASISGAFNNFRMIRLAPTAIVRKYYDGDGNFTYPIGTSTIYNETVITLSTGTIYNGAPGTRYIDISLIATEEPNVINTGLALTKYWTLSAVNLDNITGGLLLSYDSFDAFSGNENNYLAASYDGTWDTTPTVDPATNLVSFAFAGASTIDANYTAGELAAFFAEPEIMVYQGIDNSGTAIADGQTAEIDIGASHVTIDLDQIFAIENTGIATLNISSITVSGTGYSILAPPSAVAPGATENFTVRLSSASSGSFSETVTIISDDTDEGTFDFPITGFKDTWNVISTSPATQQVSVAANSDIEITFDDDGDGGALTASDYLIYGDQSGRILASEGYDDEVLNIDPINDFFPGELITVVLTPTLQDLDQIPLLIPYTFEFRVASTTGPEAPDYFEERTVSTVADGARNSYAADLDLDGDLDILSASSFDDKIAWYENNGASPPVFVENVITTAADGAFGLTVGDIDGDGDLDVLSASNFDDKVAWYENNGATDPTFTENVISTIADRARDVTVADLDGDGDLDILSASADDSKVSWYENDGATLPSFGENIITTSAVGASAVAVGDIDGDGDLDVLSASLGDDKIAWYANDGAADPAFSENIVSAVEDGAFSVSVADMDGDGDLDILSASSFGNRIVWYENDGAPTPAFAQNIVSTSAIGAQKVSAADLDGDGDMDILSASSGDNKIAWYESDGLSDPGFIEVIITTDANGAFGVSTGDIDGDNDLDVISASLSDDKISWYENTFRSSSNPPHVYWTENIGSGIGGDDEIHRTDLEGNNFEAYYSGFAAEISGLAIDTLNNRLYWTDASRAEIITAEIGPNDLSSGPDIILDYNPSSASALVDLALDVVGGHIYFTHGNAETGALNKIGRANIDGSNDIELIDLGTSEEPFGIDLDLANGKIYYTTNFIATGIQRSLWRADLDGGNVELLYQQFGGAEHFRDVKVDPINQMVYWSSGTEDTAPGTIFSNDINEAGPFASPGSFSFGGEPRGIDLDLINNKIYWVCRGANNGNTPPMIMRADLDGSNIETIFTVTTFPVGFPPDPPGSSFIALDMRGTVAPGAPEISVFDGADNTGVPITNSQTSPVDFGTSSLGTDVTRTFTIENTGTSILNINGIAVTGAGFTTDFISVASLPQNTALTFTITLSGASTGTFSGVVSIDNDDSDEAPFTFDIIGAINGVNIIDGNDNTGNVIISDQQIDIGSTVINQDIDKIFTIENLSTTNTLSIFDITSDNPVFQIIDSPSSVAPLQFAQFTVRLIAREVGSYEGDISVSNSLNDFTFRVIGEVNSTDTEDLEIYNVVTPNGDSVHDFFKIGNIENFGGNQVTIYNRWGDKVFEITGYNNMENTFIGVANVGNSKELDTGNYYYIIDKGDGSERKTGFLFLKR